MDIEVGFGFVVLNVTFDNISVISWRLFLLVKETVQNTRRKHSSCRKSLTNFIT